MNFLSDKAGAHYDHLVRLSLWAGVIGPNTYLERLSSLRAMLAPETIQWKYCDRMLRFEEWGEDEDWPYGDTENNEIEASEHDSGAVKPTRIVRDNDDDGNSTIIYFIPALITGLSNWEFHKGDADPSPSVPHGHGVNDSRRKLDPYRGFTYFKGNQDGKAPRKAIIALWNDVTFRQFATEALHHFIGQNPYWRWRVRNPLRLPARRWA